MSLFKTTNTMRSYKPYLLLFSLFAISLFFPEFAEAQCSMCRASVENSISNGGQAVGAGLNKGILYLMVAPYLLIAAIGLAWYKKSKKYTEQRQDFVKNVSRG